MTGLPQEGNEFELNIEELNRHDKYTVVIKVSGNIFGYVPCELSNIVYYLI